jgi:hypothetical protein
MATDPGGPTVLILAEASDVHALAVASAVIDLGGRPVIFDSARYPRDWTISFDYAGASCAVTLTRDRSAPASLAGDPLDGPVSVRLDEVAGVWYRRIQPFEIPPAVTDPQARAFAGAECRDAFFAFLQGAGNVINEPGREAMANRKPYQLSRAQAAGLDVPETLITNDPEAVRAFRQRFQGEVVFKILTNTRTQFTETRVLTEQALEKVGAARYLPAKARSRPSPPCDLRRRRDLCRPPGA